MAHAARRTALLGRHIVLLESHNLESKRSALVAVVESTPGFWERRPIGVRQERGMADRWMVPAPVHPHRHGLAESVAWGNGLLDRSWAENGIQ